MKRAFVLSSLLLIASLPLAPAVIAQVYSASGGGRWSEATTWVGARVPGEADAVVIRGTVDIDTNPTVASVTIDPGSVLQNRSTWYYTLSVSGAFTNNGTFRNNPDGNVLYLYVGGNLSNNGSWSPHHTYLTGTGDQTISQASGTVWGTNVESLKESGTIIGATSLAFAAVFDSNRDPLNMGANGLSLTGGGYLLEGVISTTGTLSQSDPTRAFADYTTFIGSPTIVGEVNFGYDLTFQGSLTNNGTIQNWKGWYYYFHVTGALINNGIVRNHPEGNTLYARLAGDLTNNGTWSNQHTSLTGADDQTISQADGTTWSTPIESLKETGYTYAGSNLDFSRLLDMNGDSLYVGSHDIALRNGGYLYTVNAFMDGALRQFDAERAATDYSRFVGSVSLEETFNLGYENTFEGDIVVKDTLQNWHGWYFTFYVDGDIVNNGTIRDNTAGNTLYAQITGDLTNNGTWSNRQIYLTGGGDQNISQAAGKTWSSPIESLKETGYTYAASSLDFSKVLDMNGDSLYVGSHDLTLRNGGYLYTVNAFMEGALKQFDAERTATEYSRFTGSVSLEETLNLGYDNVFVGDVVVKDTLQNWHGWYYTFYVEGDIVNNGTIRNNPSGNTLYARITGDFTNNGTWSNQFLYLTGEGDQTIAQADGTTWNSPIESLKETGYTYAASSLDFSNLLDMNGDSLYVGSHDLTIRNGGYLYTVNAFINGSIRQYDATRPALEYSSFTGTTTIRETVNVGYENVFQGDLIVADTLQNWHGWYYTNYVRGDLTNNGSIRNSPRGNTFYLQVTGDLTNAGEWRNQRVYLNGDGPRTWYAPGAEVPFDVNGGTVILEGENMLPNLDINVNPGPTLASGATLRILDGNVEGALNNWGKVYQGRNLSDGGTFTLYRTRFRVAAGALDSLSIVHHGNQVPDTYGNAVRSYWTLTSVPPGSANSLEYLDLFYDESQLGASNEETLNVYFSEDGGLTWREVSSAGNLDRNPNGDYVRLSGAPAHGTYVLSSFADPVSVLPTIVTSIIGRSQIRVGPPNRYAIHYVNNSDVATGEFLIQLLTGGGVHIESVEPSAPMGVKPQTIPLDSLTYDGVDEEAYLWVSSMAPREERTFDVILGAVPDAPGKRLEVEESQELITFLTVAAVWAGKALITKYAVDVTVQFAQEVWRPVAPCETVSEGLWTATKDSFTKVTRRWAGYEKPARVIYDEAQGELLKKVGVNIPGQDAVEVAGSFFVRGPQRYLKGDFKVKDCSGKEKKVSLQTNQNDRGLEKVTSWDPNEKVAPAGYGDQGYITDAGRMTYQILFENKAQATAPAWKIAIDDTLATEFDPATVVFEGASHEGFEMTVTGQAIHWYIEGIELPPNVTPPEGEGYVQFSVKPFSGLDSGTALRNRAVIIFDLNKPIMTNEVVNTLDFRPPVTTMEVLPEEVPGDSLTVSWTASDGEGESGVYATTVFAAMDGGPFEPIGTTQAESLRIDVEPNHTYAFYALSKDAVGNVESVRPEITSVAVVSGVATEPDPEQPFVFELGPNYPNPFNPVTSITYSVPDTGPARIVIFDAVGRQVAVVLDGIVGAGPHVTSWDAGRFASGAYFYQLTQGDRIQTRPMILLK